MIEVCKVCRRNRPTYIADPTCPKGGYCEWVETKTPSYIRIKSRHAGCFPWEAWNHAQYKKLDSCFDLMLMGHSLALCFWCNRRASDV